METKCIFKHQIGDVVWNKKWDEHDKIIQRRVEYGRPYYRLSGDPTIRPEDALIGAADWGKKRD